MVEVVNREGRWMIEKNGASYPYTLNNVMELWDR